MRVSEAAARAARERSFLCACYLCVEKDEPCDVQPGVKVLEPLLGEGL
jgi:hypothetical protein